MAKINTSLFMLYTLAMVACSSLQRLDRKNVDIHQFDLIEIGQSKASVTKVIGMASASRIKATEEFWFYKDSDENGLQRGAIVFDIGTQKVSGVTTIPRETDKELQLEYLKNVKFSSLVFEKIPLNRCQRDYFPQDEFYIETKQGVIIEFNSHHQTVESYARSSPQYALELVEKIKNCRR